MKPNNKTLTTQRFGIRFWAIAIIVAILFSLSANAQNKMDTKGFGKIDTLPRDLEIELALSALPPHLRDGATVYVLNPNKGFEVARKGTNEFHAFVSRNGDDAMRGNWPLKEYRNDILYPISFDKAGAEAIMPVFFDIAKMQAQGMDPDKLKKTIQDRYKTHYYKAPQRAGISYMLSPVLRTYVNPDNEETVLTANVPHVMYYAPNVTNEDVGGAKVKPASEYPFVILNGPHGYTIQFLGEKERKEVTKGYEKMLTRLCQINELWCLPKDGSPVGPMQHTHHGY